MPVTKLAAVLVAVSFAAFSNPATAAKAIPKAAADLGARIDREVARVTPEMVEVRHAIHANPELGNREVETAALVAERLRALGFEVKTGIAKTGVVGILRGGKPGPLVGVRADIDALPVTEESDLPFKSTKRGSYDGQEVGIAHACGHDIHTSVQLGVAAVLAAVKADLSGSVMFIFQPAEEGPPAGERGGAEVMLEEGIFKDQKPVAIFALHAYPELPVGKIAANPGPTWAAVDHFTAKIVGKQSHGAYPHQGVDPVVIASQAVMALQTIRSRNVPPLETAVVTVGIIRGGDRFNIIPGEVRLEGTVRTYTPEVHDLVERRMREILDGTTKAGGGSFDLDYQRTAPPTVNDPTLTAESRAILESALGADNYVLSEPTMGGEDFAFFANVVPSFYFRLGTLGAGTTSGGLHTPTFRGDDGAVSVGIRAMSRLVAGYLAAHH